MVLLLPYAFADNLSGNAGFLRAMAYFSYSFRVGFAPIAELLIIVFFVIYIVFDIPFAVQWFSSILFSFPVLTLSFLGNTLLRLLILLAYALFLGYRVEYNCHRRRERF